jgi:hypothetical protein
MKRRHVLSLVVRISSGIWVLGLLSSCGQPVCVAGVGDCQASPLPEGSPSRGPGQMNLVTQDRRQSVGAGGSVTLLASGGKPPYAFSVQTSLDPKGTVKVQGNGTTAIYEAPDTSGWVVIRVSDSSVPKKRQELPLKVE